MPTTNNMPFQAGNLGTSRFATPPAASVAISSVSLYTWGIVMFQVYPLNIHEADHQTETDWARKEIAGAAIYREWVGENDEELFFRGRLFPYRIGGLNEIETLEAYRRDGIVNLLMRGDGRTIGWFVCEKLIRSHTFLGPDGVGQQINFEANFIRVPVPAADGYYTSLLGKMVGQGG